MNNTQWLKLSECLFLFGEGAINRLETVDNRYGECVYPTVLFNNRQEVGRVKESIDDIQKLLDNVREKKDT